MGGGGVGMGGQGYQGTSNAPPGGGGGGGGYPQAGSADRDLERAIAASLAEAAPSPLALQVAEIAQVSTARAMKALADSGDDVELAVTMLLSEEEAGPGGAATAGQADDQFDPRGNGSPSSVPMATPYDAPAAGQDNDELQASLRRQQQELDALAASRRAGSAAGSSPFGPPQAAAPPPANMGVGGGTSMASLGFSANESLVSFGDGSDDDDEDLMPATGAAVAVTPPPPAHSPPPPAASPPSPAGAPDFAAFLAARSALAATVSQPPPNPFASSGPNPFASANNPFMQNAQLSVPSRPPAAAAAAAVAPPPPAASGGDLIDMNGAVRGGNAPPTMEELVTPPPSPPLHPHTHTHHTVGRLACTDGLCILQGLGLTVYIKRQDGSEYQLRVDRYGEWLSPSSTVFFLGAGRRGVFSCRRSVRPHRHSRWICHFLSRSIDHC